MVVVHWQARRAKEAEAKRLAEAERRAGRRKVSDRVKNLQKIFLRPQEDGNWCVHFFVLIFMYLSDFVLSGLNPNPFSEYSPTHMPVPRPALLPPP